MSFFFTRGQVTSEHGHLLDPLSDPEAASSSSSLMPLTQGDADQAGFVSEFFHVSISFFWFWRATPATRESRVPPRTLRAPLHPMWRQMIHLMHPPIPTEREHMRSVSIDGFCIALQIPIWPKFCHKVLVVGGVRTLPPPSVWRGCPGPPPPPPGLPVQPCPPPPAALRARFRHCCGTFWLAAKGQ